MRWYLSLIIIVLLILMTHNTRIGHECKWDLCPYKGIDSLQWRDSVIEHGGDVGTDSYEIDILHLKHPKMEYDELDSLLFNITYTL